jgi:DUF4097 and DUF4098 domain-containing protein YvlB
MKSLPFLLCAFCLAQAQSHHDLNLSVNLSHAETCADIQVSSSGQLARAAETFTLQENELSVLEVGGVTNGGIRVHGVGGSAYQVEACRFAVAQDQARASQLLSATAISRSGGRFSVTGPQRDGGNWQVYFLVKAPQDANLNLETTNGPIDVAGVNGNVKVRATNGPLALKNCGGTVDAQTTNGPISFNGSQGDVHLNATNGPISIHLPGDTWNGTRLEANTTNGPLSLAVPDSFQSGVLVETSGHAPFECRIHACSQAWTDAGSSRRVLRLNGSAGTVRLSTTNGPLNVGGGDQAEN